MSTFWSNEINLGRPLKCGASSFGIDSILDDNSVKEGSSHNDEGESGVNDNGNAT